MRKLDQQDHLGNSWPSIAPPAIVTPADGATGILVALGLGLSLATGGVTGGARQTGASLGAGPWSADVHIST